MPVLCSRTGSARSLSFSVWQISGSALPGYSRNGSLAQYAVYHDIERRLALVRRSTAKIHNQHAVLYRHGMRRILKLKKTGGRADNPGSGTGD